MMQVIALQRATGGVEGLQQEDVCAWLLSHLQCAEEKKWQLRWEDVEDELLTLSLEVLERVCSILTS